MGFDGFQNSPIGAQGTLTRARIKSPDYSPGISGWTLNKDGSVEFNALGGTFQVNSAGIFFYVPKAGTGNLRASVTRVDGTDPYGNVYKAGWFVNQLQAWLTGNDSHTVAINPTGQLGPELLFIPAGFNPLAHILMDGAGNNLIIEGVGGNNPNLQVNIPLKLSTDVQNSDTGLLAPEANFAISTFEYDIRSNVITMLIEFTYSGATITGGSTGNITDTKVATLIAGLRSNYDHHEVFGDGFSFGMITLFSDGSLTMRAYHVGGTIQSGRTYRCSFTYPLPTS